MILLGTRSMATFKKDLLKSRKVYSGATQQIWHVGLQGNENSYGNKPLEIKRSN